MELGPNPNPRVSRFCVPALVSQSGTPPLPIIIDRGLSLAYLPSMDGTINYQLPVSVPRQLAPPRSTNVPDTPFSKRKNTTRSLSSPNHSFVSPIASGLPVHALTDWCWRRSPNSSVWRWASLAALSWPHNITPPAWKLHTFAEAETCRSQQTGPGSTRRN